MSFEYLGDKDIGDLIVEMTLPSDGDLEDASSVDVPFEALIDDIAAIRDGNFSKFNGTFFVHGGIEISSDGSFTSSGVNFFASTAQFFDTVTFEGSVDLFGSTSVKSGATLFINSGAFGVFAGGMAVLSGGSLGFASGALFELLAGCTALVDAGCTFDISGTAKFESGALADFRNGASSIFRSGATETFQSGATETFNNGATADFKSGSELHLESGFDAVWDVVGGAITYDTTTVKFDDSFIRRSGETLLNGNDALIGWRPLFTGPDATTSINAHFHDFIRMPSLGNDRTWTLNVPPLAGIAFHLQCPQANFNLHQLTINDSGGNQVLQVTNPPTDACFIIQYQSGIHWEVVSVAVGF